MLRYISYSDKGNYIYNNNHNTNEQSGLSTKLGNIEYSNKTRELNYNSHGVKVLPN